MQEEQQRVDNIEADRIKLVALYYDCFVPPPNLKQRHRCTHAQAVYACVPLPDTCLTRALCRTYNSVQVHA